MLFPGNGALPPLRGFMQSGANPSRVSVEDGLAGPGGEPTEIGDRREKHVTVVTRAGERVEHGDVYFRHSATTFAVSSEPEFREADTERYAKESLLRVEVTQHHAACFITTATAGESDALDVLRGFRDDAMGRSPIGRALVGLYYAVSPPVADTLARHPRARTTRTVRWLVERCASLARRRAAARSRSARLSLSILLTLAYGIGLAIAVAGHACIRAREVHVGGAGSLPAGTGHEQPGQPAEHRQDTDGD